MSNELSEESQQQFESTGQFESAVESPNVSPRMFGIFLFMAAIVVVGIILAQRFTATQLEYDMQTWREKLNLIAESRTSEVSGWINENFKQLRSLADNQSLQLYLTEMEMSKEAPSDVVSELSEPSQKSYLRNLLLFTAQRDGYIASTNSTPIPADVPSDNKNALAIIDNNDTVIVATSMSPVTRGLIIEHIKQAEKGKEALIDIRKDKDGTVYIGYIVPIYSIQSDHTANSQIGRVVGIKTLDNNLFGLLKHPGITEKTLEAILVRKVGDNKIEYLSPLQSGAGPLEMVMAADSTQLISAKLLNSENNFVSSMKDYRGKLTLGTARSVAGTPWTLVVKIDQKEALATSDDRRDALGAVIILISVAFALFIFAIWWWANSRRSQMLSDYFKRVAAQSLAQEQLLRLVTDHQPEPIYIVDSEMTVRFVNLQESKELHMSVGSIPGKTLWDLKGSVPTKRIAQQCITALTTGSITYHTHREIQEDQQEIITRSVYVPLKHIPVAKLPDPTPGVLVVEQDISEVVHEREQRLKTQRQLIDMLVSLVDKRDPFAANHSKMVSQLAYEVALEMELDATTAETASKAGSLMNIGKIGVPTELLTKTSALTAEERQIVHASMHEAVALLEKINFDPSVVETLRQWQERWDGKGPMELKTEDIMISARIIAVANAFVGMISPRSWREAMPIEAVSKLLMDQSDEHFDRRVVIALINFVENHHGREWLANVLK